MPLETARTNPVSKCFFWRHDNRCPLPSLPRENGRCWPPETSNHSFVAKHPYRTNSRNQRSRRCRNPKAWQGDINKARQVFRQHPRVDLKAEYLSRNRRTRSEGKHWRRPTITRLRIPLFLRKTRVFDALRCDKLLCGQMLHTGQNEGNNALNYSIT